MIELIRYLLTATVCLTVAYCGFRLFINNRTGFHQQRLFLIFSLVISLLLPAAGFTFHLPRLADSAGKISEGLIITGNIAGNANEVTESAMSLFTDPVTYIIIYAFVSGLLLVIFLVNLIRMIRLYFLSEKRKLCNHRILVNSETESPFSFFGWIFIPADYPDDEETGSIIVHERIHAAQFHSADNILVELTAVLMWFNPMVWMIKRSVHLLHEYLADEGTLGRGIDRIKYQSLILNQAAEGSLIGLSSSFNNSLKKRMIMMTNYSNRMNKKGRVLYMIPLGLIMFFATGIINGLFPGEVAARPIPGSELRMPQPQVTESLAEYKQDTTTVRKVTVIRSAGQQNKGKKEEKIEIIGYGNQKNADTVIYVIGDKKPKEYEEIKVIGYGNQKGADTVIFVVDGKKVKDISTIPPDSIKSISVLKKDNKIIITSKEPPDIIVTAKEPDIVVTAKKPDKEVVVIRSVEGSPEDNEKVLYIIDGNESDDKEIIKTIDPSEIESITVVKGKERMKKAGKEGYDGIIDITTKKK